MTETSFMFSQFRRECINLQLISFADALFLLTISSEALQPCKFFHTAQLDFCTLHLQRCTELIKTLSNSSPTSSGDLLALRRSVGHGTAARTYPLSLLKIQIAAARQGA